VAIDVPDNHPPRLASAMYKKFALAALLLVVLTAAPVATGVLLEVDKEVKIFESVARGVSRQTQGALDDVQAGKAQTIVLIGSDRRFGDKKAGVPPRSDTLLLARLNPEKKATAMMSIPRDLRVDIPGHGRSKINEAFSKGGEALVIRTLRQLLGVPIHHVVVVNFGGFQRAVNKLGCIYVDIDRRYFNDNHPPAGSGENYAAIDVKSGYQRMCGGDSLAYVRYRHFDSDLVRAARQQDYLRNAKEQIGLSGLFSNREELLRIFGLYTQTDISGTPGVLRVLKLAYQSTKNPVQEVQFPAQDIRDGTTDLSVDANALRRAVARFMNAQASPNPRGETKATKSDKARERKQRKRRAPGVAVGTFAAAKPAEDLAIQLGTKIPFPVYYPKLAALGGTYQVDDSRTYDIYDKGRKRYRAYRIVVKAPGVGQYYGVEGMSWKSPPILDNPSETRQINGRKYKLFFDGSRLRVVSWSTDNAVYWVSNTLNRQLKNSQMLGIAESLTRLGS
jgi:LCP family protein required for cell wall assembly